MSDNTITEEQEVMFTEATECTNAIKAGNTAVALTKLESSLQDSMDAMFADMDKKYPTPNDEIRRSSTDRYSDSAN